MSMEQSAVHSHKHQFAQDLSARERAFLKARAHALQPVVRVGQDGLSSGVLAEIEKALSHHELIKIQLPANTMAIAKRDETSHLMDTLPAHVHLVGRMGRVVTLYMEKDPKDARIPLNSLRLSRPLSRDAFN